MNIQQILQSKKTRVGALFIVIVLVAAAGFIVWLQSRSQNDTSVYTSSTCMAYSSATYDPAWPDSITDVSRESYGVIIGTALNPAAYGRAQKQDEPPRVRITNVLKGDKTLHVGDTLSLCPRVGMSEDFIDNNHTVLVFLEGTNDNVWVPNRGFIGIVPQGTDQRFKPKWTEVEPSSVTVNDLQKLIK